MPSKLLSSLNEPGRNELESKLWEAQAAEATEKREESVTDAIARQQIQTLPKERDPTLEIVCWMHII